MENSPHFFKIILGDVIRQGKLGIPKKFLSKYANGLSSPVILEVPSGGTWQVELLKDDGEVWLQKGWREFAEYHSLDHGHFLVFEYARPCHFYVLIFDKSASEIEYPCRNICSVDRNYDEESQEPKMEENDNNNSVEILDNPSLHRKGEEKTPLLHPPPHEKMRTVPSDKTPETAVSNTSCIKVGNSHCSMGEFGGKFNQLTCKKNVGEQALRPLCPNTSQALEAANKYISKYPSFKALRPLCPNTSQALEAANKYISKYPSFKAVVHVDHLNRSIVSIPVSFSRMHIQRKVNLTLQVADRSWPVKKLGYTNVYVSKLGAGWPAFARENSLKKGDVCIFELIERGVMNVSIFRCND